MTNQEHCRDLVERTGAPDVACLQQAAEHVAHDLYLLRHAWVDRNLRIGWSLWFITARVLMDFFFKYERKRSVLLVAPPMHMQLQDDPSCRSFAVGRPTQLSSLCSVPG